MNWFTELFTANSVANTVIIYGLIIAIGIWLGRLKIGGISLGVTWVLFLGLIASYFGVKVNQETADFLRDFGLILFVYSVGLQVGPGFFASLKKNALGNNLLAASIVIFGIIITIILKFTLKNPSTIMAGLMSGAVTNTPGLAAAQSAVKSMHTGPVDTSMITLAYAVAYPFGVFGIIIAMVLLKKFLKVNIESEKELHRKLDVIRSKRPISFHLNLENKQLIGQPLRNLLSLFREPIVVSRMFHNGELITPTPGVIMAENDVLLVVAPKSEADQVKMVIGSESMMNLKESPNAQLISRHVVVTNKAVTHRRLGDYDQMHQHDFTFTRLYRAGIEIVPHGNLYLQLGDTVKVVGRQDGVDQVTKVLGNSLQRLEAPDLAPIFLGIVLGIIVGSIPLHFPNIPVPVKIGLAGGPLIVALILSRFGGALYLNSYTTLSANLIVRELGITLFLASVGLHSGANLSIAFANGSGWIWMAAGALITFLPLFIVGIIAYKFFRKTYFEVCGLLAGASTDPPALAFALKIAGNDIPSSTYATVYPLVMILRIVAAELLVLLFT
ncbi:MAG: putative transporter [Ginsengibacter sp.]